MRRSALLLWLCACGPAALPPPQILSISPSEMVACEGTTVSVDAELVLPTHLDYGQSEASANPDIALRIGPVQVGSGKYSPGGLLIADVPPTFAPGSYDVGLRVSDGRPEAIVPAGFTVKPTPYPDAYTIDSVTDQTAGQPFAITIRATGANAPAYNCTVALSSNHGTLAPSQSRPFLRGVRTEWVTIDTPHASVVVTARDDNGGQGSSNAFRVNP